MDENEIDPRNLNNVFQNFSQPKTIRFIVNALVRDLVIALQTDDLDAMTFDDLANCLDEFLGDYGPEPPALKIEGFSFKDVEHYLCLN